MAENFQIWQKMYLQTQDSEKTPNRINSKKSSPGHVVGKPLNTKEKKILKAMREKEHLSMGEKNHLNGSKYFIRNKGDQEKRHNTFQN